MSCRARTCHRTILALVLAAVGCSQPPSAGAPVGGSIAVRPFAAGPDVTAVTRYDPNFEELGSSVAEQIARRLEARGRDAKVSVGETQLDRANVEIVGRISRLDGGSRAARAIMSATLGFGFTSYGAGGASCGLEGEIRRGDGTILGHFAEQAKKSSTGWFWVFYGSSADRQLRGCLKALAHRVADRFTDGYYTGSAVRVTPLAIPTAPAAAPATRAGIEERLNELEGLKERGLVDQGEYERKRQQILDDL
jgi:Domain of unknown function (DUF4410)